MIKKELNKHVETMIGEDVTISGELKLSGGAIISGMIKGDVITSGIIRLTTNGVVEGNVIASEATVGGEIRGNVRAHKIILRENSKVDGDKLLHIINRYDKIIGRTDVAPEDQFIQLATLRM